MITVRVFFSCICIYLCTPHVYLYIYGAASAKPPTPKGDGCSVLLLMVPPLPPVACGGGVFGMLVMGGMDGLMDGWMDGCAKLYPSTILLSVNNNCFG